MNTLYKNLSPKCHHKHLRERFPPDYNRLLEFQRMSMFNIPYFQKII